MTDVMLDIETLARSADSVVLTIGAVKFDRYGKGVELPGIHLYLSVDEQKSAGRAVDPETVAWWDKQNPAVRDDVMRNWGRAPVKDALRELSKYVEDANRVWSQGPLFDIKILEHLYEQHGIKAPWRFYKIRDSRTLFDALGDTRRRDTANLHNALDDSIDQAKSVQRAYRKLNSPWWILKKWLTGLVARAKS